MKQFKSGFLRDIPVFWKTSSLSLVSSLIEAVTALKAPFSLLPSTMWSGSALRRIPYLSLSVDSVSCRTLSSWKRKNGHTLCSRKGKISIL